MMVPPHLRIAPNGDLIVDIQEWLQSAEMQIQLEQTEAMRKELQNRRSNDNAK